MVQTNIKTVDFSTLPTPCHYLDNKVSTMQYKYILNCDFRLNHNLVERGWRRFGRYFSRPNCKGCKECLNLRIDVNDFTFSKSARRVISKNIDTKIIIQRPSLTYDHLDLYVKYHKKMEDKKGWKYYNISAQMYNELYVDGAGSFGKEVLYLVDDKLVGVDLIDFTNDGISSIYFYYDHDYSHLSLGRYSIYKQIEIAKRKNLGWIYLGYYVQNCPSLKYKAQYEPHTLLRGMPELDDDAIWY